MEWPTATNGMGVLQVAEKAVAQGAGEPFTRNRFVHVLAVSPARGFIRCCASGATALNFQDSCSYMSGSVACVVSWSRCCLRGIACPECNKAPGMT